MDASIIMDIPGRLNPKITEFYRCVENDVGGVLGQIPPKIREKADMFVEMMVHMAETATEPYRFKDHGYQQTEEWQALFAAMPNRGARHETAVDIQVMRWNKGVHHISRAVLREIRFRLYMDQKLQTRFQELMMQVRKEMYYTRQLIHGDRMNINMMKKQTDLRNRLQSMADYEAKKFQERFQTDMGFKQDMVDTFFAPPMKHTSSSPPSSSNVTPQGGTKTSTQDTKREEIASVARKLADKYQKAVTQESIQDN